MSDTKNKEKAIYLRKQGFSINDISKKLNKNKSTISYWCRDIKLTNKQIKIIQEKIITGGQKGSLIRSKKLQIDRKIKNKKYSDLGKSDLGKISKRDLFMIGLALYWGEGYKKGNYEFGFTNSDPRIIKTFLTWLKEIYEIYEDKFILRVSINQLHKHREKQIINFWQKITKTQKSQFTKTSFIKTEPKKQYKINNDYYGTLRVKVRNGANLRRRIMGSLEKISEII